MRISLKKCASDEEAEFAQPDDAVPKAFILAADAVVAGAEQVHLKAFNSAFADEGMGWVWDTATYRELLEIPNSRDRILHFWRAQETSRIDITGTGVAHTIDVLYDLKTSYYDAMIRAGEVSLQDGVLSLLEEAREASLRAAIITTSSSVSMAHLMRTTMGPDWNLTVQIVEDLSNTRLTRSNPSGHLKALAQLSLQGSECLGVESSIAGFQAASRAGIPVVVTPHEWASNGDFKGALRVIPSLSGTTLALLRSWALRANLRRSARSDHAARLVADAAT